MFFSPFQLNNKQHFWTFLEAADQLLLTTITSGLKMHHRESFTDNEKLQWDRTRSVLTIFAHSNKTAIIMLKMMMEGCPRLQAICYANNERQFEFKSFCMPTAPYSREHNRSRSFRCLSQLLNKHSGSTRNIARRASTYHFGWGVHCEKITWFSCNFLFTCCFTPNYLFYK